MIFFKKLNFRKFFTSKNSRKMSAATVSKSPAAISKSSEKRLWSEFKEKDNILKAHVSSWLAAPENVFRWEATIIGPASCPYKNGVFNVSVHIPTEFPFEPPKITFKTKVTQNYKTGYLINLSVIFGFRVSIFFFFFFSVSRYFIQI